MSFSVRARKGSPVRLLNEAIQSQFKYTQRNEHHVHREFYSHRQTLDCWRIRSIPKRSVDPRVVGS